MSLLSQLETYLLHSLDDVLDSTMKEAMQYSLLGGGKRLRPMLLLSALQDYTQGVEQAMPIAAAIEMIHTYSLIHDDLPAMDNDTLRRGRPTCHIQFDEATAILAGDALLTHAMTLIANSSYSADKKVKMILELSQASGANGMILGQHYDMKGNDGMHEFADVERMEGLKTGKLIALPLRIAAILANQEQHLETMTEIGMELGISFQMQDDVLELTSSSQIVGKSLGSDITNNKATAVHWLGLEQTKIEVDLRYAKVMNAIQSLDLPSLHVLVDAMLHRVK